MKVDGVNIREVLNTYNAVKQGRDRPLNDPKDKLEIGDFYKAIEKAKNVKLQPDPKIDKVKTSIKEGTYNVSSEEVAKKMVDNIMLSIRVKRGGAL
ncbi:flagellar biosynthesis anti-sigma factor FlgM [Calorimonas adulescens]|jgi:Anti-sigma-28 factor, FlgM.|nr:flagellar biosynthesis anti-sigma factor FlgM [Calorimonas adulescens]